MSSAEARTLEFCHAVLRVNAALAKDKKCPYGLFLVSNEKTAKAMIFCFSRPARPLHKHTK